MQPSSLPLVAIAIALSPLLLPPSILYQMSIALSHFRRTIVALHAIANELEFRSVVFVYIVPFQSVSILFEVVGIYPFLLIFDVNKCEYCCQSVAFVN